MGASKRVCELIVQSFAEKSNKNSNLNVKGLANLLLDLVMF